MRVLPFGPFTLNRKSPQADGLLAWYPFIGDRGTNQVREMTGRFQPAPFFGSPTWEFDSIRGPVIDFDGSNQYIYDANATFPSLTTGGITIEMWVYRPTSSADGIALEIGETGTNGDRIIAHVPWGDNNLYWDYGSSSAGRISTSYLSYRNKWTHVALTAGGSATAFKAIYLDGELITSATQSAAPTSVTGLRIANGTGSNQEYIGKIADVRIYNRIRSATEIKHSQTMPFDLYAPLVPFVVADVPSGGVTVSMNTIDMALSPESSSVVTGGVSLGMNTLDLPLAAQNAVLAPGGVSISANTVNLSLSPQSTTLLAGAVSLSMSVINLSLSPQALVVSSGLVISLNTLNVAMATQNAAIVPGAVTISPNTLDLALSPQNLTIGGSAILIALNTLNLALSPPNLALIPGETIITPNTLALALAPQSSTIVPGATAISLNTLNLTFATIPFTDVGLIVIADLIDVAVSDAGVYVVTISDASRT